MSCYGYDKLNFCLSLSLLHVIKFWHFWKKKVVLLTFILNQDRNITDKDSGDENGGGYVENLSGKQLLAQSEAVLSLNRRITAVDKDPNLENYFKSNIPKWSKKEKFKPKITGFRAADYSRYRNFL